MSALTTREMTSDDDVAVSEIDRLVAADLRRIYRPTAAAIAQRSDLTSKLTSLVALVDERVVGVVRYHVGTGRLSLLGLGVHPNFRKRGVARALIQHLENIGHDFECTSLALHTVRETGNATVFERLGFVVESEAPTDLFESPLSLMLSEVFMTKPIRRHGLERCFGLSRHQRLA